MAIATRRTSTKPGTAKARKRSTATTRGAVSEAAVLEKTGKPLSHWFSVLDRFGAREKGHTLAARHLTEDHGVGGWYAQGITVAYERARGLRAPNQRPDGTYEVSVARVISADVLRIVEAFRRKAERKRWLAGADATIVEHLEVALAEPDAIRVREDGSLATFRFRWTAGTVEVRIWNSAPGKTSVSVQHRGLTRAEDVEALRALWKVPLEALRGHLG